MESTQQQYAPFTMVQRVIMNVVTEEGEEDMTVEEMHFHSLVVTSLQKNHHILIYYSVSL